MLFQLGLFKKKSTLKNLKTIVVSLLILGISVLLLSLFGPEFMRHDFVNGLGTGMIFGAGGLIIVYLRKRKEEDYEEDFEASLNDERMIQQRLKIIAISHMVLVSCLVIMMILSTFNEFSFDFGGLILLLIYSVSLIITKYYYHKK